MKAICAPNPLPFRASYQYSRFDESHLRPTGELIRVKAEAYEYRIYELEVDFMMQLAETPESQAAWDKYQKVKANYVRDYPGRPLNPKPRPSEQPAAPYGPPMWPEAKKPRKPYTRKDKAAA